MPAGGSTGSSCPANAFGGALGACHAGEIAFTFDWFAGDGPMPGWTFHDRTDETQALAARLVGDRRPLRPHRRPQRRRPARVAPLLGRRPAGAGPRRPDPRRRRSRRGRAQALGRAVGGSCSAPGGPAGVSWLRSGSVVEPKVSSSPSWRTRSLTLTPLILVPLVEPRSASTNPPPEGRISAWLRLTLGSSSVMTLSGMRPMVTTVSPSTKRSPLGSTSEPAPAPPSPSRSRAAIENEPIAHRRVDLEADGDRAHELVALFAGVVAGELGEVAGHRVGDLGELVGVLLRQVHGEVVGHHGVAPHADGAGVVHLAGEPPADLDGAQARPEGAGERPLDHLLQPLLEVPQSHRGRRLAMVRPGRHPPAVRPAPIRMWGVAEGCATVSTPTRASGGIGRRAGFRCLCPSGRGGSSPPSPTV